MGKLLKRRIAATWQLQPALDARVNRVQDLVTNISNIAVGSDGAPTDDTLTDSYIGANEFARAYHQDIVEYSDIVNDTTSGGATVPASAETVKNLQLQIDGMANGLKYIGTFDPSSGKWPQNIIQGDFWKVNGTGTIDSVDMNPGDMIVANKNAQDAVTADFDKIDNTEAPDIIRDADVIDNQDMTVDPLKIPTRQSVGEAISSACAAITIKVMVETLTVSGNKMTLSHAPVSSFVFNNEAIIEIDATNGVYDTWEGVSVVGTTATLSGAGDTAYDGRSAKITYLYI